MQPESPSTPPNPYDFITNPQQPAKRSLFSGGSAKSRIIVVAIGLLLLVLLATLVVNVLSAGSKATANQLKAVVAEQEELIRVAELGADEALSADVRGRAYTVSLTTKTDQQATIKLLEINKVKMKPEEKGSERNNKVDESLKTASASNRFDEAFSEALDKSLQSYAQALKEARNSSNNKETLATIDSNLKNVSVLLGEPSEE